WSSGGAKVGGKKTAPGPETGSRYSRITRATGPSASNHPSNRLLMVYYHSFRLLEKTGIPYNYPACPTGIGNYVLVTHPTGRKTPTGPQHAEGAPAIEHRNTPAYAFPAGNPRAPPLQASPRPGK